MASATTRQGKFTWGRIFFYTLIIALFSIVAHFCLKYYYSFVNLNEDTWGRFFYTWRSKYAYKSMTKPYEKLKKNAWNEKDEKLNKFVHFAQGDAKIDGKMDEKWMLYDFFNVHFARHPQIMYHTLDFEWNREVFLKLRKFMIKKTLEESDTQSKKLDDYIKSLNTDKKLPEPKLAFDLPEFKLKDSSFDGDDELKKNVEDFSKRMHKLLKHIHEAKDDEKILDNTDAEKNEIVDLTFNLFKSMNYEYGYLKRGETVREELKKEHVLKFWKNLGTVSTTPYESFLLSRMFFVFYFYTTSVPPKEITEKKGTKEITRKEKPNELFVSRHADFSRILAKAFKSPAKTGKTHAVQRWYQPALEKDEAMGIEDERVEEYLGLMVS